MLYLFPMLETSLKKTLRRAAHSEDGNVNKSYSNINVLNRAAFCTVLVLSRRVSVKFNLHEINGAVICTNNFFTDSYLTSSLTIMRSIQKGT